MGPHIGTALGVQCWLASATTLGRTFFGSWGRQVGQRGSSGGQEKMHGISEVDGVTEIAPASVTPAGWKEVFFLFVFIGTHQHFYRQRRVPLNPLPSGTRPNVSQ